MKLRSLASLALLVTSLGCGKMGDPMPPPRYVPATTDDLVAEQRGAEVTLTLGYPRTTVGGGALSGIDAVELWQVAAPVEEGMEMAALERRDFEALATRILVLSGAELKGATSGDRILVRHRLEQDPNEVEAEDESEEKTGYTFAVRTVASTGETSDLSNQVTLIPADAPPPPTTMAVVPTDAGIEVHWESEASELAGFHVYRRLAQERQYGAPQGLAKPDERTFLDKTAQFGERYIYALRSVASTEPMVESATAIEKELHYLDRFAPAPPESLLALPEEGRVRLRWRASKASDVAGYVLFRADPEADFRRLQEDLLDGTEYLDDGLVAGLVYRYRIMAVDHEGNESAPGETIEARPR